MSDEQIPPPRTFRTVVLGVALLIAALAGAFLAHTWSPSTHPSAPRSPRPIVQIVRQQPGLPDLSDLIDTLCPSVAIIVPHNSDPATGLNAAPAVPGSAYSSDGWLVTSAADLPAMPVDGIFGDGRRVELSDARIDAVSGLAVLKASGPAAPLPFSDQAFPRVGQFGFALATLSGAGCSAAPSMIGSDFLADGGAVVGYVRLRPAPDSWKAGTALFGADGRVLGIGVDDPAGGVIPAPIASIVLDELIRNSLSPSTQFGFRAVDFPAPFASRLGDVRSGAGIALVQAKSAAAQAGLQAGDIVTAVGSIPVSSASELNRALDATSGMTTVTVWRRSQKLEINIKRERVR